MNDEQILEYFHALPPYQQEVITNLCKIFHDKNAQVSSLTDKLTSIENVDKPWD